VKARFVTLAALVAATSASAAVAAPRTTAPPPVVDIKVTISDSGIGLSPKHAVRGAYARFILVNVGKLKHTFRLGSAKHGSGAQTGFTKTLAPGVQTILLLFLDYRGEVPYLGTLPHDRGKPRMRGVFKIT
jgi:hypothetical protein